MNEKYRVLRVLSSMYVFLGVLVLGVTIIVSVLSILSSPSNPRSAEAALFFGNNFIFAAVTFLSGTVTGVTFIAFGALIDLLIDMEHNSRRSAFFQEMSARALTERR